MVHPTRFIICTTPCRKTPRQPRASYRPSIMKMLVGWPDISERGSSRSVTKFRMKLNGNSRYEISVVGTLSDADTMSVNLSTTRRKGFLCCCRQRYSNAQVSIETDGADYCVGCSWGVGTRWLHSKPLCTRPTISCTSLTLNYGSRLMHPRRAVCQVTNLVPAQASAWMDCSSGGEVYLNTRKNSKWTLIN